MEKHDAENEIHYRLAEYTFLQMAVSNILTEEEYELLRDKLIDTYHPIIGELERGMSCQRRKSLK